MGKAQVRPDEEPKPQGRSAFPIWLVVCLFALQTRNSKLKASLKRSNLYSTKINQICSLCPGSTYYRFHFSRMQRTSRAWRLFQLQLWPGGCIITASSSPSPEKRGPVQIRLNQKLASEENLATHEFCFPLMYSNLYLKGCFSLR